MLSHLYELDRAIFLALFGGKTPGSVLWLMYGLTIVGRGNIIVLLAVLALPRQVLRSVSGMIRRVLPRAARRWVPWRWLTPKRQRLVRELLVVLVVTALAVYLGKWIVRRPRPYVQLGLVPLGGSPPRDFSFPSGHAAGAFAFATFFVTRLPLRLGTKIALLLTAAAICVSRVYLGAHFPTDILAGSLLGALVGGLGGRAMRTRAVAALEATLEGRTGETAKPSP